MKKPNGDWLKANTDATFSDGKANTATNIRNHNGSIIFAHTRSYICMDALVAESIAIKEACSFLDHAKIKEAIIESDCLNTIYFITNSSSIVHRNVKVIIEEIRRFWHLWPK